VHGARGYKTHGLTRAQLYVERLQIEVFNPRPHMSHQSAVGGIVVDADGAIGHVAATYATDLGLAALTTKASVFVAVQACGQIALPNPQRAHWMAFCFPLVGTKGLALQ
jgi:LDH2 family malate/lactate/ureidoglycolate dehydrogenase